MGCSHSQWTAQRAAPRPAQRHLDVGRFAWRTETYEFETERPAIDYLLGIEGLRAMLEAGATLDEMQATWQSATNAFRADRRDVLLYD